MTARGAASRKRVKARIFLFDHSPGGLYIKILNPLGDDRSRASECIMRIPDAELVRFVGAALARSGTQIYSDLGLYHGPRDDAAERRPSRRRKPKARKKRGAR